VVNLIRTHVSPPRGSPWHATGLLHSPKASEPTLWVTGSSHHYWTHPTLPTDSPEVVEARQVIWYQVQNWLNLDTDIAS
jgi:thymus-specific serine protease